MRELATAVVWIAAVVLAIAGVSKLRRPGTAQAMLRDLGLPAGSSHVRLLGLGELVLGSSVLVAGTPVVVAALACTYAAFAFVAARQAAARSSCGCLGTSTAPTGRRHVIADALVVPAAVAVSVTGPASPVTWAQRSDPFVVALALVAAVVAVRLAAALLTAAAELEAAVTGGGAS